MVARGFNVQQKSENNNKKNSKGKPGLRGQKHLPKYVLCAEVIMLSRIAMSGRQSKMHSQRSRETHNLYLTDHFLWYPRRRRFSKGGSELGNNREFTKFDIPIEGAMP